MHIELLNYKYSSLYNYHNKLIVYILLNKIILESFLILYKGYISKDAFFIFRKIQEYIRYHKDIFLTLQRGVYKCKNCLINNTIMCNKIHINNYLQCEYCLVYDHYSNNNISIVNDTKLNNLITILKYENFKYSEFYTQDTEQYLNIFLN